MSEETAVDAVTDEVQPEPFDFDAHRREAEEKYRRIEGTYSDFAHTVRTLLRSALDEKGIRVHSIEARSKTVESFGQKAARPDPSDADRPKYESPLTAIEDLAGCRVITFFLKNVVEVGQIIESQFDVIEKANRSAFLRGGGDRLGYESVHYVIKLNGDRLKWPEYKLFANLRVEIQVRTILQHAWAEIEHDIQYKSVEALPVEIRRRFLALAGMIEIGDREFQAIADTHDVLRINARKLIDAERLEEVEITPESLQDYLDKKYGTDGRMTELSYAWTAGNLKRMGFSTLDDLNACISEYNDDAVSRAIHGKRQGQLNRLDDVLHASMGDNYVRRHPWAFEDSTHSSDDPPEWLSMTHRTCMGALARAGIATGDFDPIARRGS